MSWVGWTRVLVGVVFLSTILLIDRTLGDDWPQWRGPRRDGVWREAGIRESMPNKPLPVRWRVPVSNGYSGPAVADGRVYLFEYEVEEGTIKNDPGGRNKLAGKERLLCLDATSGNELWRYQYDCPYNISYASGPRCTPTVDGDRVYTLGSEGDLKCVRTADGSEVWSKSYKNDYGVKTPLWGHSAHPLVHGNNLYCIVGGEGSIAVAFDKQTGEEKWRALSAYEPGYCPPMVVRVAGEDQLVIFHPKAVVGLNPASGTSLWSVPVEPSYAMSIAQPVWMGNRIFASGYNDSVFFRLRDDQGEPEIEWVGSPKTSISSANASPISDGQAIYGVDANKSVLVAVDPENGERLWESKTPTLGDEGRGRHGTVFVVRQGDSDRYWLFNESGDLILARLTPTSYEELGRQNILKPTGDAFGRSVTWSHPAFASQAVFARNDKELVCIDLAEE